MDTTIKTLKQAIFEKAKTIGFTESELYFTRSESFSVSIRKGEIEEYKNSIPQGISFRGTFEGKTGYAFSERVDESIIEVLLNTAKENALIKESSAEPLFKGSEHYPTVDELSEKLAETSVPEKIEMAKKIEQLADNSDPRIKGVDYAVVASGRSETYITNSFGLELYHESGSGVAAVGVRAVEGESTKVAYEYWSGKDFGDFSAEKLVKKVVKKVTDKLGAKSIPSGAYEVVLKNEVVKDILSVVVNNFYAEKVQKGLSLLAGKLGEKVASEKLTICDNVKHDLSLTAVPFDSEGVATLDKVVIEKGILKTFLYNQKSALKEKKQSTGNGFKGSFKSSVDTSINNFFIEAGEVSFDNMIEAIENGILITDVQGLHAGVNAISGDFSLQANGFLIQGGRISKPVEQITIAGNFYDLLKDIEVIADDLYFSPFSSIGTPSMLVKNITVSGNGNGNGE